MLSVDEAVIQLSRAGEQAAHQRQLAAGNISVPVHLALNRVLAEDISSPVDVPPRDNSAMDGYAYCHKDAEALGFVLPVSQRIPAGTAPQPLQPGTAARIFTGAEIPDGADSVAMQEDCRSEEGRVYLDATQVSAGANIRPRGQDVRLGQAVLGRGTRLRPQELGLLASIGMGQIPCMAPLKIAVFSTGDELVEPGQSLRPGQIYNSNRATLAGLLAAWGMEMVDMGICPDTQADVEAFLRKAASMADVIVTSGGVSVGEEDHVKPAVAALGSIDFWKIALKPGKPLAFGEVAGTPFVGLPGNPASVFVTSLLLLRPFLFAMQGIAARPLKIIQETSLFERKPVKRQEFLRARRTPDGVEAFTNQSSGMLSSACWGDGLVVLYPDTPVCHGQQVEFIAYSDLF